MNKINPLLYVTDWYPVPENVLQASNWFADEKATVRILAGSEQSLGWFLAQGWTVTSSAREPAVAGGVSIGGMYVERQLAGFDYIYQLSRRRLQADRVLQDMINQFTNAYNEGRLLNDRRYDEILLVYNAMLDKSQDEILDVNVESGEYEDLIDQVLSAIPSDYTEYRGEVVGMLDDYGESMRDEINTRFDNEITKARQSLITRGMHNTMTLTSALAGIEALRQKALLELDDRLIDKKLAQSDSLYRLRTEMRTRIESSAAKLAGMKRERRVGSIEFRNAIITAMAKFMEERTDDYPGVAELAKLAAGLGYADGGNVRPQ
jgi:hypothetical protein